MNKIFLFLFLIFFICIYFKFYHLNNIIDVAVIGGGISGAYISYKLNESMKYKITIFEKNNTYGGRLLSEWEPDNNSQQIINESGGMRIFPSVHKKMDSLLKELNIKPHPYPLKDKNSFIYFHKQNKKININDINDYFPKLLDIHKLFFKEDSKKNIYDTKLHTMSVDDIWDKYSKYINLDKNDKLFWKKCLGYDNVGPISAAQWEKEIKMLAVAKPSNQYLVKNGWKNVVKKLIGNTEIRYNMELISIHPYNNYYILTFNNGEKIISKYVFITIPVRNMLKIKGINNFRNLDNNLINYPGTKTFLKFKHPWWKKDFKIIIGRSITTLNSRMIYYWDSDSILIYTAGSDKSHHINNIYKKYGFKQLIKILIDELSISHYGIKNKVPYPIYASFKNWDMICRWWKPGSNVIELQEKSLYPCGKNKNVYYANSNISVHQGWMEGAIDMSDKVLKKSNLL